VPVQVELQVVVMLVIGSGSRTVNWKVVVLEGVVEAIRDGRM